MRYIDLNKIDTNSETFRQWRRSAEQCYRSLEAMHTHEERKKYLAKHSIWSELKTLLIETYGEKCWYSECNLVGSYGDIDHFRPKNISKDENGTDILPDGYWWLAYDYKNYILSCEKCNRSFGRGGKNDYFPIKAGTAPACEGKYDDIPVLLDPCNEDDVNLIDSDDTGRIIALSSDPEKKKRVAISNKIYNWEIFDVTRKKIRSDCQTALELFEILYEREPDQLILSLKQIKELTDETVPFSSFAKRYIRTKIEGKPYAMSLTNYLKLNKI